MTRTQLDRGRRWAVAIVVVVASALTPVSSFAQTVTRGPYLQLSTETSIVIRWRTDIATDSRVRYGAAPGSLLSNADDAALVTDHVVTITGLSAASEYYYSVGTTSTELAGNDANTFFITHPPVGTVQAVRVWVIGDHGWGNAGQAAVRDRYYAYSGATHTDLWLQLGDNAYTTGTDAEFGSNNFAIYTALYRKSVSWPCIGNHEGVGAGYYPAFTLPTAAEAGGVPSGTEAYYSFDFANIHFINLDSQNSSRAVGGAMYNWLESDLQNTLQDWIIAYWHHPPYSKGSHNSDAEGQLIDMRQNFLPLLESYGIDLVLSGHSHSYERSQFIDSHYGDSSTFSSMSHVVQAGDGDPAGDGAYTKLNIANDGAVYSVVGSSGTTSGGSLNHPAMQVSLNVLGSMVIDVNDHQLDAIMLDDLGATRDTFRIVKMEATPSATPTIGSPTPTPTATPVVASCDAAPRVICASTTRASFKQRGGTIDPARRQVLFKWLLGNAVRADFSDPVSGATSYALCVYGDGSLLSDAVVVSDGNWRETATGFRYVNSTGNVDGVAKVILKEGAGKAKLLVKARGAGLDSTLPAVGTASVVVQLVKDATSGSECWEATLPALAIKQDAEQFKDKIP